MKDAKGHGSNARGAHQEGVIAATYPPPHAGLPLKMMRVSALHPTKDVFSEDNHQAEIDSMRSTLRAGGMLPPLIVTPRGNLLDGHHRLAAYKAEGVKRVQVGIQSGWNEAEIERVRKERGL